MEERASDGSMSQGRGMGEEGEEMLAGDMKAEEGEERDSARSVASGNNDSGVGGKRSWICSFCAWWGVEARKASGNAYLMCDTFESAWMIKASGRCVTSRAEGDGRGGRALEKMIGTFDVIPIWNGVVDAGSVLPSIHTGWCGGGGGRGGEEYGMQSLPSMGVRTNAMIATQAQTDTFIVVVVVWVWVWGGVVGWGWVGKRCVWMVGGRGMGGGCGDGMDGWWKVDGRWMDDCECEMIVRC